MPYFLVSSLPAILFAAFFCFTLFALIKSHKSNKLSIETKQEVHEIKEQVAKVHAVASKIDTQVNDQENIKRIEAKLDKHMQEATSEMASIREKVGEQESVLLAAIEKGVERSKTHNLGNLKVLMQFMKENGVDESVKILFGENNKAA